MRIKKLLNQTNIDRKLLNDWKSSADTWRIGLNPKRLLQQREKIIIYRHMSHNLIAINHLQIGQVILRAKNSFGYVFKQIVRKVSEM